MRPMHGPPENFQESLTTPTATFPEFLMGFVPIEPINVHAKFEIRSFSASSDNRGYPKNWAVPGYAHGPFFLQNVSWPFIQMDPLNVLAKFEICSFSRSWDNRGYPKNLGSLCIRPRFLFSNIFMGFYSDGPCECTYWLNLKCVVFPVPEIIWGTQKIWAVPGYAHSPFSPKYFMGYYSDGHCYCSGQIWRP